MYSSQRIDLFNQINLVTINVDSYLYIDYSISNFSITSLVYNSIDDLWQVLKLIYLITNYEVYNLPQQYLLAVNFFFLKLLIHLICIDHLHQLVEVLILANHILQYDEKVYSPYNKSKDLLQLSG